MQTETSPLALRHRLGLRIGVIVFLVFLLGEILLTPLWELLLPYISDWGDPDYIRAYADWLEGKLEENPARSTLTEILTDPVYMLVALAYYSLTASALAITVSLIATRRLRKLSSQASAAPITSVGLPAPFEVGGRDEIRLLADSMNTMRGRIAELIEQVEDRDRQRTEWVSHVSHDLRTPLMALTVVVDRARSLLTTLPPAQLKETLTPLLDAAELDTRRIRDLAEDLLELARMDITDELALESVPPGELLGLVASALRPIADSRGVALRYDCPVDRIELQADGRRLIRAVENITLNSLQHASTTVDLTVRRHEDRLQILVEDDGPGLPAEEGHIQLTRLGHDPSRRDSAGIGLEVAQRIIAAHGGDMLATNRPGSGARVLISLPLA